MRKKTWANKWEKRYLGLAKQVSSWSLDPSTQVGCVIIDAKGRPVSFGYNGFARGMDDSLERLQDREFKYAHTIHAEKNAVLAAGRHLDGCTVYITHPPCTHCLSELKQAFVDKIVCYEGNEDFKSRWNEDSVVSLAVELGINLEIIKEK